MTFETRDTRYISLPIVLGCKKRISLQYRFESSLKHCHVWLHNNIHYTSKERMSTSFIFLQILVLCRTIHSDRYILFRFQTGVSRGITGMIPSQITKHWQYFTLVDMIDMYYTWIIEFLWWEGFFYINININFICFINKCQYRIKFWNSVKSGIKHYNYYPNPYSIFKYFWPSPSKCHFLDVKKKSNTLIRIAIRKPMVFSPASNKRIAYYTP